MGCLVDRQRVRGWRALAPTWPSEFIERLLEELRVSLFAQELRTPMPVSVKRLQKAWAAIMAGH